MLASLAPGIDNYPINERDEKECTFMIHLSSFVRGKRGEPNLSYVESRQHL